jgi:hypothetical protein
MNEVDLSHPSPDQLAAFVAGRLGDIEVSAIETHLADCTTCSRVLQGLPPDTLVALLRDPATLPVQSWPADSSDPPAAAPMSPPAPPSQPEVPAALADHPRYRVVGLLGLGGMGVVYRAEHRLMGRPVALKVLNRNLLARPGLIERFRREVQLAARLAHPNSVTA